MPNLIDLTGQRFGRLTVVKKSDERSHGSVKWVCKCDCGNTKVVVGRSLRKGYTKSCGCIPRGHKIEHGMSHTRIFNIWQKMIRRCESPNDKSYPRYGGRGITVCEKWHSFQPFYEWAKENGYDDTLTIDRIDNDKGYSPDNCRWSDAYTQSQNRRSCLVFEKDGKSQTLKQWCRDIGISYTTVYQRIRHGWSFERAISEPVHAEKRNGRYTRKER